ncbi:hypothetical protein ES708_13716 [subsurface metagenome]
MRPQQPSKSKGRRGRRSVLRYADRERAASFGDLCINPRPCTNIGGPNRRRGYGALRPSRRPNSRCVHIFLRLLGIYDAARRSSVLGSRRGRRRRGRPRRRCRVGVVAASARRGASVEVPQWLQELVETSGRAQGCLRCSPQRRAALCWALPGSAMSLGVF